MIFNIQRYSLHDGEGIRSTVFLKGCPLHCPWCSNPESQKKSPELMFESSKCIGCRDCFSVSHNDEMTEKNGKVHFSPSRQKDPEVFRDLCPAKALQVIGENKSVDDICETLLRDQSFYSQSRGGVTLSGGEPLTQPRLCLEIAKKMQEKEIPVSIETCLHVPWRNIEPLVPFIDEFLCDVKHNDALIFKKHTGGDLSLIIENLKKLSAAGASIRVRVPVIYGFNHDEKTIQGITNIIKNIDGVKGVDFMPYHPLGIGKYKNLGRPYTLPETMMGEEELLPYIKYTESQNIKATIGG